MKWNNFYKIRPDKNKLIQLRTISPLTTSFNMGTYIDVVYNDLNDQAIRFKKINSKSHDVYFDLPENSKAIKFDYFIEWRYVSENELMAFL